MEVAELFFAGRPGRYANQVIAQATGFDQGEQATFAFRTVKRGAGITRGELEACPASYQTAFVPDDAGAHLRLPVTTIRAHAACFFARYTLLKGLSKGTTDTSEKPALVAISRTEDSGMPQVPSPAPCMPSEVVMQ